MIFSFSSEYTMFESSVLPTSNGNCGLLYFSDNNIPENSCPAANAVPIDKLVPINVMAKTSNVIFLDNARMNTV